MKSTVYNKCNHFYLDNTVDSPIEIIEPINWDAVEIVIKRDEQYYGTAFQFSDGAVTLQFGNKSFPGQTCSKDVIDAIYEVNGSDAVLQLVFGYDDPTFIEVFRGDLDFTEYTTDPYYTEVQLREVRFDDKIRTRFDTTYDIKDVTKETFSIHSYPLVRTLEGHTSPAEAVDTEILSSLPVYTTDDPWNFTIEVDTADYSDEIKGKFSYGSALVNPLQSSSDLRATFQFEESGFFTINIDYRLSYSPVGQNLWNNNLLVIPQLEILSSTSDLNGIRVLGSFNGTNYTYTYTNRVYFSINQEIFIRFLNLNDLVFPAQPLDVRLDQADVIFTQDVLFPHEKKPMIQLKTGLQSLLDKVVEASVPLDSTVLDTELIDFYIQNGIWLRGFADKAINITLQDYMVSLKALFNVGFSLENVSGVDRVRVEFMEYFFSDEEVYRVEQASQYSRSTAGEIIYNEIEIGYSKASNSDKSDGSLINFHSSQIRSTPILKNKNKYLAMSPFTADFIAIDDVMRQIPEDGQDDSGDSDQDIYILKTLESGTIIRNGSSVLKIIGQANPADGYIRINGDLLWDLVVNDTIRITNLNSPYEVYIYGVEGVAVRKGAYATLIEVYQGISTSQTKDLTYFKFEVINKSYRLPESQEFVRINSGLDFSDRAMNVRMSPLRNLYQHGNLLISGWWNKLETEEIKFLSGKSNVDVITEQIGIDALLTRSILSPVILNEGEDQTIDVGFPRFKPTWLNVETDMELSDIFAIKSAYQGDAGSLNYGYISVKDPDTGEYVAGYPYEIKYNMGNGKVTFKLLERDLGVQIPVPIISDVVFGAGFVTSQTWRYPATVYATSILLLEYRINGGAWQGSNAFTNLLPNTTYFFEVRDTLGQTVGIYKTTGAIPAGPNITNLVSVGYNSGGLWRYQVTVSATGTTSLLPLEYRVYAGSWGAGNVFTLLLPATAYTFEVRDAILQEDSENLTTGVDIIAPILTGFSYTGYLSGTWKVDVVLSYTDASNAPPYQFQMETVSPPAVYRAWQSSPTFVDITLSTAFIYKMRNGLLMESNTLLDTSPGEPGAPVISSILWTYTSNPFAIYATVNPALDPQVNSNPRYQLLDDGYNLVANWQSSPFFANLTANTYYRFKVQDSRQSASYEGMYRSSRPVGLPSIKSVTFPVFGGPTAQWSCRIDALHEEFSLSKTFQYRVRSKYGGTIIKDYTTDKTFAGETFLNDNVTYWFEIRDEILQTAHVLKTTPDITPPVITAVNHLDEGTDVSSEIIATSVLSTALQYAVYDLSGIAIKAYQQSNQFFGLPYNTNYSYRAKDVIPQETSFVSRTPTGALGETTEITYVQSTGGDYRTPTCDPGLGPLINMYHLDVPLVVGSEVWADPPLTVPFATGIYDDGTGRRLAVRYLLTRSEVTEILTGCP